MLLLFLMLPQPELLSLVLLLFLMLPLPELLSLVLLLFLLLPLLSLLSSNKYALGKKKYRSAEAAQGIVKAGCMGTPASLDCGKKQFDFEKKYLEKSLLSLLLLLPLLE